jgi:hypothetical protein
MAHPTDWTCYICGKVNPASATICENSAQHYAEEPYRTTLARRLADKLASAESLARLLREQEEDVVRGTANLFVMEERLARMLSSIRENYGVEP